MVLNYSRIKKLKAVIVYSRYMYSFREERSPAESFSMFIPVLNFPQELHF